MATHSAGNYSIMLSLVPEPESEQIDFDTVVRGELVTPGQRAVYTFEARAGDQVALIDVGNANNCNIRWVLVGPGSDDDEAGAGLANAGSCFDISAIALEVSGTHTLTIDGLRDTIGEYSLMVERS